MTDRLNIPKTPERELRAAKERLRLGKEGTIDAHVLEMRRLRAVQAAQSRIKVLLVTNQQLQDKSNTNSIR